MDTFEIAATMKSAENGILQWREIVQCFKTYTWMKREAFTVSEKAWRNLGADHGGINSGQYKLKKTCPQYSHYRMVHFRACIQSIRQRRSVTKLRNSLMEH